MLNYDPQKIVRLREQKDWNQSELARAAKLSPNTIWNWENGNVRNPKFATLAGIAGALGVPVHELLSTKQPPDLSEKMMAVFVRLSPDKAAAIYSAAEAMLQHTPPEK